jgi:hypothetical protein
MRPCGSRSREIPRASPPRIVRRRAHAPRIHPSFGNRTPNNSLEWKGWSQPGCAAMCGSAACLPPRSSRGRDARGRGIATRRRTNPSPLRVLRHGRARGPAQGARWRPSARRSCATVIVSLCAPPATDRPTDGSTSAGRVAPPTGRPRPPSVPSRHVGARVSVWGLGWYSSRAFGFSDLVTLVRHGSGHRTRKNEHWLALVL